MELMGVTVFLPFVDIIMDPTVIETNETLAFFYSLFKFGEIKQFIVFLAIMIALVYIVKAIYLSLMQMCIRDRWNAERDRALLMETAVWKRKL